MLATCNALIFRQFHSHTAALLSLSDPVLYLTTAAEETILTRRQYVRPIQDLWYLPGDLGSGYEFSK